MENWTKAKCFSYFTRHWGKKLMLHFKSAWVNERVAPWWDLEHENSPLPFVVSPAWPGSCPEALSVNVKWQPVNIGENSGDKDKKLLGVKGVGGNSVSAGDSSRWKIFWGCWSMMAWTTAVKHTHFANRDFFFQAPFPSCLGKAALHVDWGRGNPVCSCHRPVMNHYPVIWPPSPLTRGGGGLDLQEETTVETST